MRVGGVCEFTLAQKRARLVKCATAATASPGRSPHGSHTGHTSNPVGVAWPSGCGNTVGSSAPIGRLRVSQHERFDRERVQILLWMF